MVDVAGVDVGAAIDQELRHLHGLGEVQRRLPVAAARVDQGGIVGQHPARVLEHPEPDEWWISGIAPRPMRNDAIHGVRQASSRTWNPPAHQWLFWLMFAPARRSTSTMSRFSRSTAASSAVCPNAPPGAGSSRVARKSG